jgi:hypothetical protein
MIAWAKIYNKRLVVTHVYGRCRIAAAKWGPWQNYSKDAVKPQNAVSQECKKAFTCAIAEMELHMTFSFNICHYNS